MPRSAKALKKRGSRHAKKRAEQEKNQPKTQGRGQRCPKFLSKNATKYWPEIEAELHALGLSSSTYSISMGLLVESLAAYVTARQEFEKSGGKYIVETSNLNKVQNPAVGAMNTAWGNVLKICTEFGLTPKSRTAVDMRFAARKSDDGEEGSEEVAVGTSKKAKDPNRFFS